MSSFVHEDNAQATLCLSLVPVCVNAHDIDVCYSGTKKCLSCPPGLGPITFGGRAVAKLNGRVTPVRSWHLHRTMMERYWGPERTYRHTAPSQ